MDSNWFFRWILVGTGFFCAGAVVQSAETPKQAAAKIKEVAGTAEFLRSVPKRFATLVASDPARQTVTLLIEGEAVAKIWPLVPDAEIKVAGWWGRLSQFTPGDRVWVWLKTNRAGQPVAISMLADEPSQQDIHERPLTITARGAKQLTLSPAAKPRPGEGRVLQAANAEAYRGAGVATWEAYPVNEKVYVQTAGERIRLLLDAAAFEARRAAQQTWLREEWAKEGLPGTIAVLHIFSGEMEVLIDHEAMRWARSLKLGDTVKLQAQPPIAGVVKAVRPWRERTEVRLVVNGVDQADLAVGQRIHLFVDRPPLAVDTDRLPPDRDRPRTKAERVDWFLASIYCSCGVAGDTCTGHFYTLASCNPNGCGMPNQLREEIAAKIDKKQNDQQIFEALLKEHGPNLLRPHLMP